MITLFCYYYADYYADIVDCRYAAADIDAAIDAPFSPLRGYAWPLMPPCAVVLRRISAMLILLAFAIVISRARH